MIAQQSCFTCPVSAPSAHQQPAFWNTWLGIRLQLQSCLIQKCSCLFLCNHDTLSDPKKLNKKKAQVRLLKSHLEGGVKFDQDFVLSKISTYRRSKD